MEAIIVALITGGLSFLGIVYTSKQQHSITIEEVKNELSLIKKDIKSTEYITLKPLYRSWTLNRK